LGSSPRLARGIVNTIMLGIVGAILSTALGTAYALLLTVTDIKGKAVFAAVPWVVFATPSYFKGLAWLLLMSPGGYFVDLGLISPAMGSAFFGPAGLTVVLALSTFTVPYFIVRARLQGLGGEYIDAARIASARPWRIVTRVVLPMLAPAIALALLTTFAEIVGDFGMATTLARSMNFGLITYNIYAATSSFPVDFASAGAQALLLVALVVGSIIAAGLLGGNKTTTFVSGRSRSLARFRLGAWQIPTVFGAALFGIAAAVLPLFAVVARSVTVSLSAGLHAGNFSLDSFHAVFDLSGEPAQSLLWSLGYGVVAACLAVIFGLVFAYRVSLAGRMTRMLTSGLTLTTIALPGILLAFGYILVYDRLPGFKELPLYGSRLLLVLGYAATGLPYCLIFVWSALGRLGASMTEASRLAGASPARHLRKIIIPLVGGAIVIAFGVTTIRSIFELPMSQMLLPQAGPPVPVLIVDDFLQGRDSLACALALVTLAIVAVIGGLTSLPAKFTAAPHGDR
ncbi:MAG: iron transporter permease, partial [Hyphomicrobiales bacterium]|nr:iron transporter permease [Hyphomicrobiales bacterium]